MGRKVIQSAFHIHFIESIDDLLEVSRKYRESTDEEEKKRFSERFDAMSSVVDECLKNYKVNKLKFTIIDENGKTKNIKH